MPKKSGLRIGRRETFSTNLKVANILQQFIKSALGPRSMEKILIDPWGDITVTSDGKTILDGIDVQHPAAKMMVEAAKAVDIEVGDGTITTVLLACELLKRAEGLIEQMHPTEIIKGYSKAAERAVELLEGLSIPIDLQDPETLQKVALTSLHSKVSGSVKEHFARLAVDTVKRIAETRNGKAYADIERILVIKRRGGSLLDTKVIDGIVEIQTIAHPNMPRSVVDAKIALLNYALIVRHPEITAQIRMEGPGQVKAFLNEEVAILKEMVRKVANSGANVLICQADVDDAALDCLAGESIATLKKVSKNDMEKIAKATGGRVVAYLNDLSESDIGYAKLVEERTFRYRGYVEEDRLVFIEGCRNPKSVTILIRGGLDRALDQAEIAIHDALSVISDIFRKSKAVAGGGAIEVEIAKRLREYSTEFHGREQLAVKAYADSTEIVPRTLIENAGLDQLDFLTTLRAMHLESNGIWIGIDPIQRKISSMKEIGVLEPTLVKEQAIRTATEVATAILRVDDIVASKSIKRT